MHEPTLRFNSQDWQYFAELLKKGYTIQNALQFMGIKERYLVKLKKEAKIEEILLMGMRGKKKEYALFFLQIMNLDEAILSALAMENFEKTMKTEFIKQISYPLLVFILSFITVFLFSYMIIPQLIANFDVEKNNGLFLIVHAMKYFSLLLLYLILLILVLFVVIQNHSLQKLFYRKKLNLFLIKDILSYRLAGYFLQLHEKGLSSKQSFQYLRRIHNSYLFCLLIQEMNEKLKNGEDLLNLIKTHFLLNEKFKRAYVIGFNINDIEKTMYGYLQQQKRVWMKELKWIGIAVQVFSYLFIGILVICVYQIMLIPLQLLEEL